MANISLKQLEAVRTVAQTGTIVQASEILHVTPAALTARIKSLEDDLAIALFDRLGGRLRLTDAGREAVTAAGQIDRILLELSDLFDAIKGMRGGRVSIGVVSTAKYFAPSLVAAFWRENPRVDLRIAVGNRSETIAGLRDYGFDMALMGRPPADFTTESEPFGRHPHVVIAAPDHPLASRPTIAKEELADETFVVREEGSGTRSMFEYFFNGVTFRPPRIAIEIDSNETIKQAVMAGLGLGLISAHTIEAEANAKRLVVLNIAGMPIIRQWFVVRRGERPFSPPARAMWEFVVRRGNSFLPRTDFVPLGGG